MDCLSEVNTNQKKFFRYIIQIALRSTKKTKKEKENDTLMDTQSLVNLCINWIKTIIFDEETLIQGLLKSTEDLLDNANVQEKHEIRVPGKATSDTVKIKRKKKSKKGNISNDTNEITNKENISKSPQKCCSENEVCQHVQFKRRVVDNPRVVRNFELYKTMNEGGDFPYVVPEFEIKTEHIPTQKLINNRRARKQVENKEHKYIVKEVSKFLDQDDTFIQSELDRVKNDAMHYQFFNKITVNEVKSLRDDSKISFDLIEKMIGMRMKKGANFCYLNMDKTQKLMESNSSGTELLMIPDVLPSDFPKNDYRYLFVLPIINNKTRRLLPLAMQYGIDDVVIRCVDNTGDLEQTIEQFTTKILTIENRKKDMTIHKSSQFSATYDGYDILHNAIVLNERCRDIDKNSLLKKDEIVTTETRLTMLSSWCKVWIGEYLSMN